MGKKLKNAPVYYSVAQVRHNPVLRIGAYIEEIQDRMRKAGYPGFAKGASMAFSIPSQEGETQPLGPPTVERIERLIFSSIDNTKACIVEQNGFSFQTTEYDTFETFTDEFMKGLSIVHECLNLALTERVGLRYLDAVVPPNGEAGLPDFLKPGAQGLGSVLPQEVLVSHSISETHFRTPDCAVLARTIVRWGPLGFPMDLQPMGVVPAERFQKINGVHAIIDADASIESRQPFDLVEIRKQLGKLRTGAGIAFEAIVTPSAMSAWNS